MGQKSFWEEFPQELQSLPSLTHTFSSAVPTGLSSVSHSSKLIE